MKANIRLHLTRLIPSLLLTLLRNVIEKLTGNAALPTPPVSLANMSTAADTLEKAIEAAIQGSRYSREVRDAQVLEVRAILTKTANYVRTTANGDGTILASNGFDMAKEPGPIGIPAEPSRLRVTMGPETGSTLSKWGRVHGATSYQLLRTTQNPAEGEATWTLVGTTSKCSFIDAEVETRKAYFYCVRAVGYAGIGKTCMPVMGRAA
ncbi:MAG: hypothetical protein JNL43_10175 [Flavobacteriales bacterium]|nr:hypothetical protein [Flavobacteriales bacterium]